MRVASHLGGKHNRDIIEKPVFGNDRVKQRAVLIAGSAEDDVLTVRVCMIYFELT